MNPETPLKLTMVVYHQIPKSISKVKQQKMLSGLIRPTKKPDTDNLVKCVTDSCNGLLWVDDSIITDLTARKRYTSELARVVIKITEVTSC
jgi:Holliday junction resolvase RusA-like endonuclease